MKNPSIRVRFAPAPTGMMHLGNVRAALMNYLFAQQKNGTFVLRIEDTDPQRNFDPGGQKIMEDLAWLNVTFDEGPDIGGPHAPYLQSQRTALYEDKLKELHSKNLAYRCFCTTEKLEKKRQRQIAMKMPPRYDRTCLKLSAHEVDDRVAQNMPFVWRVKLDHDATVDIHDLAHGTIHFEFKNFSDFPLTRQNGSFTFMFANFVDDMEMEMTHVMRGEDHQTNTAGQAALYMAFGKELPTFWHMPILCNIDGKKLSKRDFGFSLRDLKDAGYLPEAICNYLGIIGSSFMQEIMSLEKLAKSYNFENMHTTGHIRYDVDKLKWINHKWITNYNNQKLAELCKPFLSAEFESAKQVDTDTVANLVAIIKTDLQTLADVVPALKFYFVAPTVSATELNACVSAQHKDTVLDIIKKNLSKLSDPAEFAQDIKFETQDAKIPLKEMFWTVRLALTGKRQGPTIANLVAMLGADEAQARLKKIL